MDARENSRIIVRSDWDECLRGNDGTAWVTFKRAGQLGVHGELNSFGIASSGEPYLRTSEGFSVEDISRRSLTVTYQNEGTQHRCRFQAPVKTFASVHRKNKTVSSLDVTPGGLAVSSDTEGNLKVWTTDDGDTRRNLEGHAGDVYNCKFFPSGVVVLSSGADTQIKIWSAESGKCAATLTGHRAAVTDTAIVERGRNVVSVSKDGTAKLWDCGSSTCLATVQEIGGGVVNSCAVSVPDNSLSLGAPSKTPSEKEALTEGKMLLLGCELGSLQGYGLRSRQKIFQIDCSDAVNCVTYATDTIVVCGTQDGQLYVVDLRNTDSPLAVIKEQRSAILSLLPHKQGILATSGDGSCFHLNEMYETTLELTGADCDAIYSVVTDGSYVYTSCRDGTIRKYTS